MHSLPYLSNQLAQISSIVEVPATNPDWIPFSIPLIIKQLVGDALTSVQSSCAREYLLNLVRLEQINLALDYNVGIVT
jgi:hypothetical protein